MSGSVQRFLQPFFVLFFGSSAHENIIDVRLYPRKIIKELMLSLVEHFLCAVDAKGHKSEAVSSERRSKRC